MGKRKPSEPVMSSGREGHFNEYVEFAVGKHKITFVAQKTANFGWFVYEVHPGSHGRVSTLASFTKEEKEEAVKYARQKAEEMFWG